MKILKLCLIAILFSSTGICFSQEADSVLISRIYREALTSDWSYNVLRQLCKETPHRLAGSEASLKAIQMMYKKIKPFADTVYLQEVTVKHWLRGKQEEAAIVEGGKRIPVSSLALGGSIGTGKNGIQGNVIEVHGIEELKKLGKAQIEGKIVFYNQAMDPMDMNPGRQYGKNVSQRFFGAEQAAYLGAKATIVRSLSVIPDKNPHTGVMRYVDSIPKIPSIAISTLDADLLSKQLKQNPNTQFFMRTWCESLPDEKSYNVIAEIKGTEKSNEIITVGGHLDCWDIGEGANDDGAGCAHSIEVLRLLKQTGIQTKRTVRVVLFIDEEMYQCGANKYAESVKEKNEKIYFALETDSGGSLPIGFGCTTSDDHLQEFTNLKPLFETYGVTRFRKGGGGTDIEPLEEFHVPLLNLIPEPQRYFELHHSANDVFERISMRELQMGGAAIAAMVVMLDEKDVFGK